MRGDGFLVETLGLAGQLDFAVQRLVGHAEQGAIGHPEPVTLRGDGGAFHIDTDGAAERQAARGMGVAQFPIAIIGGDDGAGTHALFQVRAGFAADDFGGLGQRQLHLGDGGDGDFGRQNRVQHMVVTQIGVGQHIVADPLRVAQAPAMADHQPSLWPQHREVVADGLGVGRANADVDQADPAAIWAGQVIGGHLVAPPRGVGQQLARVIHRFVQQ